MPLPARWRGLQQGLNIIMFDFAVNTIVFMCLLHDKGWKSCTPATRKCTSQCSGHGGQRSKDSARIFPQ
jgi:hypothetical protein